MQRGSSLPDRWRSHVARRGLLQRSELTDDGLVLGARTLLAASFYHPDETAAHDRLVALLAAAYDGRVDAAAPPRIAKAMAVWRSGDRALAACHLALARLPPVAPDDAYRLFLASLALDEGLAPSVLLREIGATEAARLLKFDPAQPRVPAGSGRHSGEWTSGDGGDAPGHDAAVQLVANTTTNFCYACKKLKIDPIDAGNALHAAKEGRAGAKDVCIFDLLNGDIIFNGEVIGNLRD